MQLRVSDDWPEPSVLLVDGEEVVAVITAAPRGMVISSHAITNCPTLKVIDKNGPPSIMVQLK